MKNAMEIKSFTMTMEDVVGVFFIDILLVVLD